MKKFRKCLSLLLSFLLIAGMLPATALAVEGWDGSAALETPAGSGSEADPYRLKDAADLKWFAEKVNGSASKTTSTLCALLTADIDLEGQEWEPIGRYASYSDYVYYGGIFDGNGKTVSDLHIDTNEQYQALFGYVKGGTIRNLRVEGSVATSASSSSYAAGIVGYGSPVTLENCVNNVSVSASAKGYCGGIIGYAGSGSVIMGCTNSGRISGCGDYVGGIAGTAVTSVKIEGCINNGAVTNTGKPSSYAYSTGGIAGGISGTSSIIRCGNTGDISSTLKRTGGIVGSLGGTVEKCFNTGNVEGTYGAGGIAGDSGGAGSSLSDCYNLGTVTGNEPAVAFSDTNAKGVGGIIGGVSSTSNTASLKNCYNAGNIVLNTSDATVLAGGIVGNSSGKSYSGAVTSGLVTAQNCYYLASAAGQGDGYDASAGGSVAKSAEEMKSEEFAALLGNFIADPNGGYPILAWQDPEAAYTVAFSIAVPGAGLTVRDSSGVVMEPESEQDFTYLLKNGDYTYTVTCEECEDVHGSFTVAYGGQTISVSLEVKTYPFIFSTTPRDAELIVEGQTPLPDGRTYNLPKAGNPYRYTARTFGYEGASGTFIVTGNPLQDALDITLTEKPRYPVVFSYEKEEGGPDSTVTVHVTSGEYPSEDLQAEEDGSFLLPDGTYSYRIMSAGYKTVSGSFTVSGKSPAVPKAYLAIQTAWDGNTLTEPAQDSEGVYLISTPDELMWFNRNAGLDSFARLTADIRINEDMSVSAENLYVWNPMGASSSKAYTGVFDGDGHTISGVYVDQSGNNAGLFGYVSGGSIRNLTVSDSLISGAGNYVGTIAGDLKGTIENCHVTDSVAVSGKGYVGGVVGELDSSGSVAKSSNAGAVHAFAQYAGGIAGRVYSDRSDALTDSFNSGSVTADSGFAGGVVGSIYSGGSVQNVYNTGAVKTVGGAAGGLIGSFRYGSLSNAYTVGSVEGAQCGAVAGGLDFPNGAKSFASVFYLGGMADAAIGDENGCAIQNGEAKSCTEEELKGLDGKLGSAFAPDSGTINKGYPILSWQAGGTGDTDVPEPDPEGWDGKASETAPRLIDGVYQISSPAELKWFAEKAAEYPDIEGILTEDVDLNNRPWEPIGGDTAETAFLGVFDGNGKGIRNLYIQSRNQAGLFAYNGGEIRNVTIEGLILNSDNAGAVASCNGGKITNVASGVKIRGGNRIAGITALNKGGTVEGCTNTGIVSGGQYVGGITAVNEGTVTFSKNIGMITAGSSFAAGIAADNDGGIVKDCANSGHVVSRAALRLSFVGGLVGRNNGTAKNLYNTGNVVCLGSSVGGCVGINTTGSTACDLYNAGDVLGSYVDTEDGEEFRVGGAVGEMNDGVSEAYYLKSLSIFSGGTPVSKQELMEKAGILPSMLPEQEDITGTLHLGKPVAGSTAQAVYQGNARSPFFVWYISDGYDEAALAVGEEYEVPASMAGRVLRVKAMDPQLQGVVTGASDKVEGFTGSVKITGSAVVGRVLQAEYMGEEVSPSYQWYRGERAISGATNASYTVTEEDRGQILTVRVRGSKPGYIEKKTAVVLTEEEAGMWPVSQCEEPQKDAQGVYQIGTERELKWFVSFVNGGNPSADAKLTGDIELQSASWYPIGSSRVPYTGTFDGNGKKIRNFRLSSSGNEQGFFGNVGGKGEVKDLHLSGTVEVIGSSAIATGGIAGFAEGRVTGCSFEGSVNGSQDVGGIVGQIGESGVVSQCINTGEVKGSESVGGIAGSCSKGEISQCVNKELVGKADSLRVGGIVGDITNYAIVTACYNTADISGSDYLGGIAGKAYVCAAPQGCYTTGKVPLGLHAFGVLGDLGGTDYIMTTHGSFYLTDSESAATDVTATGVSSESMKKASFVSMLNAQAGKEYFAEDEKDLNGGYPLLLWQTGSAGEGGGGTDPEEPKTIKLTFTLLGDTPHGEWGSHTEYVEWIPATECTLENGATAYDLFRKLMKENGFSYEALGNGYVSSVTGPGGVELEELANGPRSGWMYTINGEYPDYMPSVPLKDGDKMVFFYTDDYTDTDWNPMDPMIEAVERLIDAIGTVTLESGEAIKAAREAYELLTDLQKLNVANKSALEEAEKEYARLLAEKPESDLAAAERVDALIDAIGPVDVYSRTKIEKARQAYESLTADQKKLVKTLSLLIAAEKECSRLLAEKEELVRNMEKKTAEYLLSGAIPGISDVGGDWVILGLARGNRLSSSFRKGYYENVVKTLRATGSEKLHRSKSTENSRVILALTSLGYDASDIAGYNLLAPLADFSYVKKQGLNGLIWALIAFDSAEYTIPKVTGGTEGAQQTTREALLQEILSCQLSSGGWSMDGETVDVDITAMALQALSSYYGKQESVTAAVDKALKLLSLLQNNDGSCSDDGEACAESCAQVVVALASLEIDPDGDSRFIKNGHSVLDALTAFWDGNGFRHTSRGETDAMATEQGYYALVAYIRYLDGGTALFDMKELSFEAGPDTTGKDFQESGNMEVPQTGETSSALPAVYMLLFSGILARFTLLLRKIR